MTTPLNGCLCQDGACEACNRLQEAFEAMREALQGAIEGIECYAYKATVPARDWVAPRGACDCWGCNTSRKSRAALALAKQVTCEPKTHRLAIELNGSCPRCEVLAKGVGK